ncbi:MAG: NUDIX domain-containing protein [Planctomycetota bacterium]
MSDEHPIRAAGLLLRREPGKRRLWLLLRNSRNGEWGFPKGHADDHEDDFTCALRECAEETGIALIAADGTRRELRYRLRSGALKQVVYVPARTATDRVTLSHEHDRAGWFDAKGVLDRLSHESLSTLFRAHLRDFTYR